MTDHANKEGWTLVKGGKKKRKKTPENKKQKNTEIETKTEENGKLRLI